MKIGNVKIKNGFLLAPMAGFSTPPFRRLCHEFGAGLTTSEMVSSEAVVHHNPRTLASLERAKDERPFAIQIVGSEPLSISLAATILQPRCEIVDINLGCPACAVTGQGAGAALLDDPAKIARIFDSLTVLKIHRQDEARILDEGERRPHREDHREGRRVGAHRPREDGEAGLQDPVRPRRDKGDQEGALDSRRR
jgi:hypothetical protein